MTTNDDTITDPAFLAQFGTRAPEVQVTTVKDSDGKLWSVRFERGQPVSAQPFGEPVA